MIKLKPNTSARNQMNIKEVKDGVLVLPGNKYRIMLETSAINFELKSEEEQDQIIDNFQNFLNSLPCPVQILIRTREVDIDSYIEELQSRNKNEKEIVYKDQLNEYALFIRKLISGNKILSRRFYLVIPYQQDHGKQDFELIKDQLQLSQDIIAKGLEKLGMKTRALGNLEILDLFYSFYNPSKQKTQPLTEKTFHLLHNHADLI